LRVAAAQSRTQIVMAITKSDGESQNIFARLCKGFISKCMQWAIEFKPREAGTDVDVESIADYKVLRNDCNDCNGWVSV
jgi:hypothetical protein